MKYELRVEFDKDDELKHVIEKSYFDSGTFGKLSGKKEAIKIKKDDPLHIIFRGLNNMTVRLHNPILIDGSIRMVIDEQDWGVDLYPCSVYCIVEDQKYSFY